VKETVIHKGRDYEIRIAAVGRGWSVQSFLDDKPIWPSYAGSDEVASDFSTSGSGSVVDVLIAEAKGDIENDLVAKSYNFCTFRLTLILLRIICAKVVFKTQGVSMAIYGYARVSTDGQTLTAQQVQLRDAGAAKIFAEKISGARSNRAELEKLLNRLETGDVLMVTRLDRLARSTRDLLNILDCVAQAGAGFRSLADAWADTTTPHGRLMLTVLGGLAEFERELIRARTGEGRARAKARGVHMGRPPALTPHQRKEAIARRDAGESLADIGRSYDVSHSTISRLQAER
jgi:DNA invertase Pin-like site-specific DNA recombinase